jgi:predicted esterase
MKTLLIFLCAVFCRSCFAAPALAPEDAVQLQEAMGAYFAATPDNRKTHTFAPQLEKWLLTNESEVRRSAWQAYQAAPLHEDAKANFEARRVRFEKHLSPYTLKSVGTRPANGWPLFIAMHGGGGAPKALNDSQWQHMQIYYKDHPELGGYLYLALRAPNDTWNGFYDDYVYPLVANLIKQCLLFGEVDADKVFLMGYSHGGYGAYAIGPKMPHRFAAIHASAAAATDGETSAKTLRSTPFSAMVGEKDTAYDRFERNQKFAALIPQLRGERTDIYPVKIEILPNYGHGGLPDRDKIVDLYPHVRNTAPRELTWEQTDSVIRDFFWLQCEKPGKNQEINATCRDNRISLTTTPNASDLTVFLDNRLVDFSRPVSFEVNGKTSQQVLLPSLRVLCDTLLQRGDPNLAFTAQWKVPFN